MLDNMSSIPSGSYQEGISVNLLLTQNHKIMFGSLMEILLFLWPYHEPDWEDHPDNKPHCLCIYSVFIYLFIYLFYYLFILSEISPSKHLHLVHQVFTETAVSVQHMEEG